MSYTDKQEELLRSLDYVEPEMIAGAVRRIDENKSRTKAVKKNKVNLYFKLAAAAVACLAIIAIAWPTSVLITEYSEYSQNFFGAGNSGAEIEKIPEYDGSRGLLYEVNEDGTAATFIGYGSCTDETVYIASTYDGLPVTRMYNKSHWDAEYHPADVYFGSSYVKHLVISDTVKTIDNECLRECPKLESIYFGAGIEKLMPLMGNRVGNELVKVDVSSDNPYYTVKGNCLIDTRTKTLVIGTPTSVIPDDGSVEIIGYFAFSWARSTMTSIIIPEGIKIIEMEAFSGCRALESVILPDSLEIIDAHAFQSCSNLKTLTLGTNLKVFSQIVFQKVYCPDLYYKGTVAQWEAIVKPMGANNGTYFISIPVICSDGEALSDAGVKGNYHWKHDPQFKWYWNRAYPDVPFPEEGPWNTDPLLEPKVPSTD